MNRVICVVPCVCVVGGLSGRTSKTFDESGYNEGKGELVHCRAIYIADDGHVCEACDQDDR